MPEYQEKAVIVHREEFSAGIVRLSLRAPLIAGAGRPGQFVMLRAGSGFDPLLRRPFSLHQVASDGTIQVLFKVVGRGTARLAELRRGDHLDCLGPLGRWFPLPEQGRCCLVGGGMGIAPLYFLARRLVRLGRLPARDVILLGGRTREEVGFLADQFFDLGYQVEVATDDGSLGHHGLVVDLLAPVLTGIDHLYSCGPEPMMRRVAEQAETAGVDCWLSLETHMACGLGACLGCARPDGKGGYVHVCLQGPVFAAKEVTWPR